MLIEPSNTFIDGEEIQAIETVNEQYLLSLFPAWRTDVIEHHPLTDPTFEDFVEDFQVVNWAWEIGRMIYVKPFAWV